MQINFETFETLKLLCRRVTSMFECGHSKKPDCDESLSKCLSRQYLGKVRIWLLTGQNLGHPGVMFNRLALVTLLRLFL